MRLFDHNCDVCRFLGHYQGYDLYFCSRGSPTVIARDGNEPAQYASGMGFAMTSLKQRLSGCFTLNANIVALRVARLIALDLGFHMNEM